MVIAPLVTGSKDPVSAESEVLAAAPDPVATVGTTPEATAGEALSVLASEPAQDAPALGAVEQETEERRLEFIVGEIGKPGSYQAEFINRGGRIANLRLTNFVDQADRTKEERRNPEYWVPLLEMPTVDGGRIASLEWRASESSKELLGDQSLQGALWVMKPIEVDGRKVGVDFHYAPGTGLRFTKRIRFNRDSYEIHVELEIANIAAGDEVAGSKQFSFTPAVLLPRVAPDDNFAKEPQALAGFGDSGDVEIENYELGRGEPDEKAGTLAPGQSLRFAGVHNKSFVAVARPVVAEPGAMIGSGYRVLRDLDFLEKNPAKPSESWRYLVNDISLNLKVPVQGQKTALVYELYAGPKSSGPMTAASADYAEVMKVDLGFFSGIASLLLAVLGFFHSITGNWGFSIILLTMSVRLVLFPINRRSQTAMSRYQAKMKRLQPKIDEVKKKYESDTQRQRQEQAKLMQSEGAFPPLGGCAPMFLQIPVFWGLFSALRVSFDLRQAPFLGWIRDLSKPDALMELGWTIPVVGWQMETLNVLPPLMVVLWVLQQRSMPKPADDQAARMQKMMMWMPVLFGVMLYNYAAGLSLYMITQSGLGIFEQRVIKKYWPVDDTEQPKKKSGFMSKLAKAQEEQMKRLKVKEADKARTQKKRDKAKKR